MQANAIKPLNQPKRRRRIGRGGKRGNYSGRGSKGQKSRAGAKIRSQLKEILNKFPKKRGEGFKIFKSNIVAVNLEDLQMVFPKGGKITPQILYRAGMIPRSANYKLRVKILAGKTLNAAYDVSGCLFSKKAEEAVLKAGGKFQICQKTTKKNPKSQEKRKKEPKAIKKSQS